jgi:hypothetical protein
MVAEVKRDGGVWIGQLQQKKDGGVNPPLQRGGLVAALAGAKVPR